VGKAVSADVLDKLGAYALRYVKPGQTVGLGTGRAAAAFIRALGERRIRIRGVPTSSASAELARSLGIEIVPLDGNCRIDVDVDGADEVDRRLNLIKGLGGALVREKIVASAARKVVILVGEEKLVARLGSRRRLPVEVVPFAKHFAIRRMRELGLRPAVRMDSEEREFLSDNGNVIVDCTIAQIEGPARLERALLSIPGVVGSGLFLGIADIAAVATADSTIRTLHRRR